MSDTFGMQRRYFTTLLDQYRSAPALNRAKIRDCEHYIEMLEEAGSLSRFMEVIRETGNMVSTAKAEIHDRYVNRVFIYQQLGQERKAEADRRRLELTEAASTHQELAQSLEDFEEKNKLEYMENQAIMAVGSLIKAVFHLATDPPGSAARTRNLANLEAYWKLFSEADTEASWERLLSYAPYRDRIIFTDAQLTLLEPVFREANHG